MRKMYHTFLISIIFISLLFHHSVYSQNCLNTSVGYIPINDLESGYFNSYQGGLYPNGTNVRPEVHNNAGIDLAGNILPLDTAGNYNAANGRIVLLSVGMSNCAQEFQEFINSTNGAAYINSKLSVINGAQGGQTIDIIINPNANFWTVIKQRLNSAGLSEKQVQAVWFKEAQSNPADTSFPGYPDSLKSKFKIAMGVMKEKYENLNLCYLASRIYAGYASTGLNPEPFAYYSGWSVKWMIEDQINGDTSLIYNGSDPNSPWLSWGPYLWADGLIPRSDGLTWNCPADYAADGTHPSVNGRQKVADLLIDFFLSDETAKPWFLKTLTINMSLAIQGFLNPATNRMSMNDTVRAYLRSVSVPFNVIDSSIALIDSASLRGIYRFYNASSGTYYLQLKHRNSIETWSRAGGELYAFGSVYNYDFTNSRNKAYGNNLILRGSEYCIYNGDIDQNGTVDLSDLLDTYNVSSSFGTGYLTADLDGDNTVDLSDITIAYNNARNFIIRITP